MPPTDSSLRIQLLGRFQVAVDGAPIDESAWPRRQAKQLIKLLALAPNHQLHREQLMDVLWPDASPASATNSLNKLVHMARRALEPTLQSGSKSRFLHRESEQIVLSAAGDLWVDADEFEVAAEQVLGHPEPSHCEAVLAAYQGALLEEDRYEDWAAARRERLATLYKDVTLALSKLLEAQGRFTQCIPLLGRALDADPTDESIHQRLIYCHAQSGNRQRALAQYDYCLHVLAEELGTKPSAETVALRESLLSVTPAPDSAPPINRPPNDDGDRSLAVLRFAGSGDADDTHLYEGLPEALIHQLARTTGLRVMARSVVARYDPQTADPRAIGQELNVNSVLMGRIRVQGERVLVSVELIRAQDGQLIWGERYEEPRQVLSVLQERIAQSVLKALVISGQPTEPLPSHSPPPAPRSYELLLRGRHSWNKRTPAGLSQAIDFLQEAIEHDPDFALAYAGLADCYNLASLYGVAPPHESMPRAKAAASRAVALDPTLAEGHTSLAYYTLYYEWDWSAAEELFLHAISLNNNYATARHWYHECLTALGRFEEQSAQLAAAKHLDPLSPIIATEVGWGLYFGRKFDDAKRHLRSTLALEPRFAVAHFILGLVCAQTGELDEAIRELDTAIAMHDGGPFTLATAALGYAQARRGDEPSAQRALSTLTEIASGHYVSPYCFAIVHAGLNNDNAAFEALALAANERSDRLIYLNVDPVFDPLRAHPTYADLAERMRFPR